MFHVVSCHFGPCLCSAVAHSPVGPAMVNEKAAVSKITKRRLQNAKYAVYVHFFTADAPGQAQNII